MCAKNEQILPFIHTTMYSSSKAIRDLITFNIKIIKTFLVQE